MPDVCGLDFKLRPDSIFTLFLHIIGPSEVSNLGETKVIEPLSASEPSMCHGDGVSHFTGLSWRSSNKIYAKVPAQCPAHSI